MKNEVEMLNESLVYSLKKDKVQLEYQKICSPYFRITLFRGIIIFFILMTIIALLVNSRENAELYQAIGFGVVIFIVLLNSIQRRIRMKKNEDYLKQLKEEYQELTLMIRNTGVPEQYSYTYAIEKLLNYLTVGRAESFKEAMNLYETEMRHDEQINKLREIQTEQEKQIQELRSIKNIVRF